MTDLLTLYRLAGTAVSVVVLVVVVIKILRPGDEGKAP
jgi:hypothetical protein